jgi:nucleotide-binding universal stress UspA family protein
LGLGSVADELIRRSPFPILLVRPGEKAQGILPEPVVENVLIPLDGSALAEQILGPAVELAQVFRARCVLLRVVESAASTNHQTTSGSAERVQAETYLERIAARLREPGVNIEIRVVTAPHAVEGILEEARDQSNHLIALATHGRGGFQRMLLGSVADKLIRTSPSPVLVYRPTGKGS